MTPSAPSFSSTTPPASAIQQAEQVFRLFGLQPAFGIDMADLEQRYLNLQSESHPDRFAASATTTSSNQHSITERSSAINYAYQQLRQPFERAKLLIILNGIADPLASNQPLPPDFLFEKLEQRETFEDATMIRDQETLQRLAQEWHDEADALWYKLEQALDVHPSPADAALYLRQLKFLMTQLDTLEETLFEWSL